MEKAQAYQQIQFGHQPHGLAPRKCIAFHRSSLVCRVGCTVRVQLPRVWLLAFVESARQHQSILPSCDGGFDLSAVPWLFRSVGLRLELRCESLAVLKAITTPAASLQSFLTELTGGQFSSVRDGEGDPTSCSGQLLSEMQLGQSVSAGRDTRNSFSGRTVWTPHRLDGLELDRPSAEPVAQQPGMMGSRLPALGLSGNGGTDSSLSLLRRWRAIKRGA